MQLKSTDYLRYGECKGEYVYALYNYKPQKNPECKEKVKWGSYKVNAWEGYYPRGNEMGVPGLTDDFSRRAEVFRLFCVSTLLRALRMSSSFNFFDIDNSIKASPFGGRQCTGT